MNLFMSGAIIKQLRQAKKITQEELANEICSVRNLRQIENGEHNAKQITIEQLLKRLGEDTKKFSFHSQNISDNRICDAITKIHDLIQKRDFLTAKDMYCKLCENKSFVSTIKTNNNPAIKIYKQYSLHWEAVFLHNLDGKSKEALEKEYQAIRESIGDSPLNIIENKVLSEHEYEILNAISLLYFYIDETDKGIEVLKMLKASLEKTSISKQLKSRYIPFICYNLSKYLGIQKNYTEACSICDEGIEVCIDTQSSRYLGHLYYNKAVDIYYLRNEALISSREYFNRSYYAFLAVNDFEMAEIVKRNALEKYSVSL